MTDDQFEIINEISGQLSIADDGFAYTDGAKTNINQYTGSMTTYCTAEDLNALSDFNNLTNTNFIKVANNTIEAFKSLSATVDTTLSDYVLKTTLTDYYTKIECDNKFWTITAGQNYVDSKNYATEAYVQEYHSAHMAQPAKFSGKSMFEVFYALTTEQILGAIPLDGKTYDLDKSRYSNNYSITYSDFKDFADELLIRASKIPSTVVSASFDDYDDDLINFGECAKFGLKFDKDGKLVQVRVPCIKSIIQPITPTTTNSELDIAGSDKRGELSEIIPAQIPNIRIEALAGGINNGYLGLPTEKTDETVFYAAEPTRAMFAGAAGSADEPIYFNLNVGAQNKEDKKVYKNGCETVQPQTVIMQLYMQIVPTGTQYIAASNLPIGTIFIYPSFTNLPDGAYRCDGAQIFSDGYMKSVDVIEITSNFTDSDYNQLKQILVPNGDITVPHAETETEWRNEKDANGGFTGKFVFGTSNGLEYIRLPYLNNCFIEGTTNLNEIGKAEAAGLPNITGMLNSAQINNGGTATGCFAYGARKGKGAENYDGGSSHQVLFDASRCSNVYKNECETVQPPSVKYVYCIQISGNASKNKAELPDTADYVIESWNDDDGNWYRKYRSGWVEQGGVLRAKYEDEIVTTTLFVEMKDTNYSGSIVFADTTYYHSSFKASRMSMYDRSTTSFKTVLAKDNGLRIEVWKVEGQSATNPTKYTPRISE